MPKYGNPKLIAQAKETQHIVESLIPKIKDPVAARSLGLARKYDLTTIPRQSQANCPQHKPTKINVINDDTINAALRITISKGENRPLIVNFANAGLPGGGWLSGHVAQEECIAYRSSLWLGITKTDKNGSSVHYPMNAGDEAEALYSPLLLVVRDDMESDHKVWEFKTPEEYPTVSCVTIAADRGPETVKTVIEPGGKEVDVFKHDSERERAKQNMRLVLRIAQKHGHEHLVLGALGCGVYKNPVEDVAQCWVEVLDEHEFHHGWWKTVIFAVYDPKALVNGKKKGSNLEVFERVLDEIEV
ncbi:hypothetical protein OQA88_2895 [Cercophora sp. LCS_1]